MKYEIRLSGSEQDSGKIESGGKSQSAQSIITITHDESDTDSFSFEEQIQKMIKDPNYKNRLGEIVGQWPGDESVEEILKYLD